MISTAKIKQYVLPNLPYAFLFWVFNKAGESVRTAPGEDMLRRIMYGIANLNAAFANPLPSFNPTDLLVGLISAAAIYLAVLYKRKNRKNWRKDIEYGSARFGSKKDIEPYMDLALPDNNVILTATESIMLDGRPANPKYARNKNVLVVGGSGSGKTRFFVKPQIMQMHSSYVITDPKGSLY